MPNPPILTSISGLPKSGKTYLACTWPDPMKIYSFEHGARWIIDNKFASKKIDLHEFDLPILETDSPAPFAEKIWDEFLKEYKEDVYSGNYQTLIVDTATHLWGVLRQAITEAKNRKRLQEVEYALPNLKMGAVFSHAAKAGVNLVVLQYLRDKYVKGENTGELELNGWGQTEGQADIVLEIRRITKGGKTQMITTMNDIRFNRDLNGTTLIDTNYNELMKILF